jgi:hypothetical protein
MGITVVLEDEHGTAEARLEDPQNLLHDVLAVAEAKDLVWTPTIDRYGDTTFNYLQVPRLRLEWQALLRGGMEPAVQKLLLRIDELAARCESERHLYLKFYGD